MLLAELQTYIAREKHLPALPSAEEIQAEGLNLSQFQLQLLEKIEELTLYTLAQETQLAEKAARLSALEREQQRLADQNAILLARLTALEQTVSSQR